MRVWSTTCPIILMLRMTMRRTESDLLKPSFNNHKSYCKERTQLRKIIWDSPTDSFPVIIRTMTKKWEAQRALASQHSHGGKEDGLICAHILVWCLDDWIGIPLLNHALSAWKRREGEGEGENAHGRRRFEISRQALKLSGWRDRWVLKLLLRLRKGFLGFFKLCFKACISTIDVVVKDDENCGIIYD